MLDRLEKRLGEALAVENYELAALLRDMIKQRQSDAPVNAADKAGETDG